MAVWFQVVKKTGAQVQNRIVPLPAIKQAQHQLEKLQPDFERVVQVGVFLGTCLGVVQGVQTSSVMAEILQ